MSTNKNGLINQDSSNQMASIHLIYKNGSQIEREKEKGLAHLVEHLMFKDVEYLFDTFDENCVTMNAYTSGTTVVFYLEFLETEPAPYIIDYVNKIVNCKITKEDFEKEKDIVMSEYQMSLGSEAFYMNVDRYLFGNYNPIGKADDIINVTYEDFMPFVEKYFRKPSKLIYTSKEYEIDESDLEFEFASPTEFEDDIQLIDSIQQPEEFEVEMLHDLSESDSVSMMMVCDNIITEDFNELQVVNKLLGGGLNSPLFQIREKHGLAYSLSINLVPINEKQCTLNFYIDTDISNVDKVEDAFFDIIKDSKNLITTEMLDRRKKKEAITEQKIAIDRYQYPDYGNDERFESKVFLETFEIEDVHALLDKYYINNEWIVLNDKMLY